VETNDLSPPPPDEEEEVSLFDGVSFLIGGGFFFPFKFESTTPPLGFGS
jgi:hypothetical protein